MTRTRRVLLCALLMLLLAAAVAAARTSSPLGLDTGFGRRGVVTPGHSVPGFEEVGALAIAPGRHIFVAAESIDSPEKLVLARYYRDGEFEPSFGDHGYLTVPIAGPANALVADGGRIFLLTGRTTITRLSSGGGVDGSYGADGSVHMEQLGPSLRSLHLWSMASLGGGSIVAAGLSFGSPQMVAIRLLPDGRLDPSFNDSGSAVIRFGAGNSGAIQVKVQPDGKLVLAGYADGRPALARLLPNGRPDRSFGRNGRVVSPPWLHGRITALTVRRDGSILAGASGWTRPGTPPRALLLRYSPSGRLDRHFGATAFPGSSSDPKAIPIAVLHARRHIFMATRGKGPSVRALGLDGRPIPLRQVPGVPQDRWFHIDAAPQDRQLILAYTPQHAPGEGTVEIKRFLLD